jgi:hypothetical protein
MSLGQQENSGASGGVIVESRKRHQGLRRCCAAGQKSMLRENNQGC